MLKCIIALKLINIADVLPSDYYLNKIRRVLALARIKYNCKQNENVRDADYQNKIIIIFISLQNIYNDNHLNHRRHHLQYRIEES